MPEVETHSYDDAGQVEAETVITIGETEFVVVQDAHRDDHRVFQREKGAEQPHTQWTPEERSLEFPAGDEFDPTHEAYDG